MCYKFHMFHGHTVLRIASILDDLGLVLHFGNVQPLTIIEAFVCGLTFVAGNSVQPNVWLYFHLHLSTQILNASHNNSAFLSVC